MLSFPPSANHPEANMPQVFISYARDKGGISEQIAVAVHEQLTQAGLTVFRDVESLDPGDHWATVIQQQISASRVMVVVVSRLALDPDRWVMRECLFATGKRIPLIPLLVEEVEIPLWLAHINAVDFTRTQSWNRLLVTVGQRVAEGKVPSVSPFAKGSTLQPKHDVSEAASPFAKGGTRGISPPWASDAGNDKYGRYADLTVEGVTQRFRWIEPGTFWMGSPESEKGRYDWEIRHQVTLTKGYWLADTACTQALWVAVMDGNPAKFQNDLNNPVEQVSWEDIQEHFLLSLNSMIPNLNARLPTETEWEYACRAGTTTAYFFGNNISDDLARYGKWFAGTVPVKSFSANPWGLYQMHGNVWEWCQDASQEKLLAESVTDQQGVASGDKQAGVERVIRGGSWGNLGRFCRSASRHWFEPDVRLDDLGFRLVLGH
jgi:formylglycine-generating enzyme required for sulfatase activity